MFESNARILLLCDSEPRDEFTCLDMLVPIEVVLGQLRYNNIRKNRIGLRAESSYAGFMEAVVSINYGQEKSRVQTRTHLGRLQPSRRSALC